MRRKLVEHQDFYFNEQGYMVLTDKYLLEKGECCGNGCKHCPYNYVNVEEATRSTILGSNNFNNSSE